MTEPENPIMYILDVRDTTRLSTKLVRCSTEEAVLKYISNTNHVEDLRIDSIWKYTYGGELSKVELTFIEGKIRLEAVQDVI